MSRLRSYLTAARDESSPTLRDATTMARELARTVFAGYRLGLLHGKMKADQKDAVMRRFRPGTMSSTRST